MTLERDIEVLKRVPFLADLPAEPAKLLAFSAETSDLSDGTVLFEAGDPADCAWLVMSGRVDLRIGAETMVSAGPGTLIGELALLIETNRPAKAVVVGKARLYRLRRANFRRVLDEYPDVTRALQRRLIERLTAVGPEIERIRHALVQIDPAGDEPDPPVSDHDIG